MKLARLPRQVIAKVAGPSVFTASKPRRSKHNVIFLKRGERKARNGTLIRGSIWREVDRGSVMTRRKQGAEKSDRDLVG